MGLGFAGALAGLGQGLGAFGQTYLQGKEREDRLKQQAIQNMLAQQQLGMQRHQMEEAAKQREFQQGQFLVQNAPENTPLSPEVRAALEAFPALAPFVRPDMAPTDPMAMTANTPTAGQLGLAPAGAGVVTGLRPTEPTPNTLGPLADTGRGYTIPTEDSKMRVQQSRDATSLQRIAILNASRERMATERAILMGQRNQLMAQANTIRDEASKRAFQAAMASVNARLAGIDQQAQELDALENFRYGVQAPYMQGRLDVADYNAQYGGGGQARTSSVGGLDALAAAGSGAAAPPAGAPAAGATPPAPKKPPVQHKGPKIATTRPPRRKKNKAGDVIEEQPDGTWKIVTPAGR